jgi:hypothetical protein
MRSGFRVTSRRVDSLHRGIVRKVTVNIIINIITNYISYSNYILFGEWSRKKIIGLGVNPVQMLAEEWGKIGGG